MASIKITPKDIIKSAKHFKGDIFEWDCDKASDNQANSKKKGGNSTAFDATWVPLLFKKIEDNGNVTKTMIKDLRFEHVVAGSKPTIPNKEQPGSGSKIKCLLMVFKKMSIDYLLSGDYAPKTKESPEQQEIENKRARDVVNVLYNNNNEFIDALEAIDTGFQILGKKIKSDYENGKIKVKFNLVKESSWEDEDEDGKKFRPPFRSFKQSSYRNPDNPSIKIKMENPIYRLKLPVVDDAMLISWRDKNTKLVTQPYIYNARKTEINTKTGAVKLHEAKVLNEIGRQVPLDIHNVDQFITERSILSGTLEIPKIVISKQGFSLVNEFKKLVVKKHKKASQEATLGRDAAEFMMNAGAESDDEDATQLQDLDVSVKQQDQPKVNSEEEDDQEDESSSEEEVTEKVHQEDPDEPEDPKKKSIAKKVNKKEVLKKPIKKEVSGSKKPVSKKPVSKKQIEESESESDSESDNDN
jgi:hypothetical protein